MAAVLPHPPHADGNVDERIAVAVAGFEQQHANTGLLGQPVGERAAGGAGANDDEIKFCFVHSKDDSRRSALSLYSND